MSPGFTPSLQGPSRDSTIPALRLHVRDEHIGRIMGKGGAIVTQLQHTHQLVINIPKQRIIGTKVREVWLRGQPTQLHACHAAMLQLLHPDPTELQTTMLIPPAWPEFPVETRPSASPRMRRSTAAEVTPSQPYAAHRAMRFAGGSRAMGHRLTYPPTAEAYNYNMQGERVLAKLALASSNNHCFRHATV